MMTECLLCLAFARSGREHEYSVDSGGERGGVVRWPRGGRGCWSGLLLMPNRWPSFH